MVSGDVISGGQLGDVRGDVVDFGDTVVKKVMTGLYGVVSDGLEVVVRGLLITTGGLGCLVVGDFGVVVGVVKDNIVGFGVVKTGGGYAGEVVRGGRGV